MAIAGSLSMWAALPGASFAAPPRYRIVDLGTLGGPASHLWTPARNLNNRGEMIANSDTAVSDPNGLNGITDGYVLHGVLERNGLIVDLGTPGSDPATTASIPTWIADSGYISGLVETGGSDPLTGFPQVRATLWFQGVGMQLGTLGGNGSQAFAVNSRGDAVGVALNTIPDDFASALYFLPTATQAHAVIWHGSAALDLGTLGGTDSNADFINERGQIVGESFTDTVVNESTGIPTMHPFLWEADTMHDLGSLGGTFAIPGPFAVGGTVLNSYGLVAGTSTLPGDANWHAFLWHDGAMHDLGTLGGSNSEAYALNDAGDVVGRADYSATSDAHHAVLWHGGAAIDLGSLGTCANSTAVSINAKGQIVAETGRCPGEGHPFLAEHGGPPIDLNDLVDADSGITVSGASYINDRGEISAFGTLADGSEHVIMLVPNP